LRVETSRELAWALNRAHYQAGTGRPVLVEAVLPASDAPLMLQELTRPPAAWKGRRRLVRDRPEEKRTSHARHRRPGSDPSRHHPHARSAGPGLRQLDAAGTGRGARGGA